ncbi:ABC transporter ATP-binding protein [Mongoliitalea daihaiensis]|uniref:ABC transporter ATP-binding protein n=1 Tax=Mongoliitalea daihaiensis TaxID=2782006 RepID=UPI001F3DEA99|nr:ABC transporter ATP-binding protein [Mongoliitalea daihaiensis]UJP65595.1 ATP-binding cassette domain-containing protein [Mongoliitalea daihaiensis]
MNILEIKELHKSYATTTALDSISIDVPHQGIFGLLGPNGAGKSTLIRIINQIIEQDSGEIFFNGEKLNPHHISNIGYLPEERGLYKKMKVWDQLIFFARLKGMSLTEAKNRVKSWLQKFEIEHWRNKSIDELSKGMAQKIQFIATVIHEPQLLILDEPFSGFDPVNAELIKNEILELRAKGVTIILSTHRMESVELLCDTIALLHRSRVILQGSLESVKDTFAGDKYHVKLRTHSEQIPDTLIKSSNGNIHLLEVALDGKKSNELLHTLMEYGEILEFSKQIPSMEQIFIQQVNNLKHG